MTTIYDLRVDSIVVGDRLRPLNPSAVAELKESFRLFGQIQPITIHRPVGIPRLVAGYHRLIAARELKLELIACVMMPAEATEDDCLQAEIAENLHRNELSKDERDQHIRLLAEILLRQANLQSTQNAAIESKREDGRGHRPQGTVAKIAEQTGLSKDTVRRALNPEKEAAKREAAKVSDAAARAEEQSDRRARNLERAGRPPEPEPIDQFAAWVDLTEQTAELTADAIFAACPVRSRPTLSQRCEAVRTIIDRLDELVENPPARGGTL